MTATRSSHPRSTWWFSLPGVFLLGALISASVAWWLIAVPVATMRNAQKHVGHFGLVYLHMIGGSIMLSVGAFNLYTGATRNFFRYHRRFGLIYLVGGSLAASAAIALALGTVHDPQQAFTFNLSGVRGMGISLATLAVAWLVSASMAFRAARNKRFESHRVWMIRSYVLAWSFVLCRL